MANDDRRPCCRCQLNLVNYVREAGAVRAVPSPDGIARRAVSYRQRRAQTVAPGGGSSAKTLASPAPGTLAEVRDRPNADPATQVTQSHNSPRQESAR